MESEFDDLLGESEEPSTALEERGAINKKSIANFTEPKAMVTFLNKTRTAPLPAIDDLIINGGYAAAVWMFRAAAMSGDYQSARALNLWLTWAAPHIAKPKRGKMKNVTNKNAAAFLPREASEEKE